MIAFSFFSVSAMCTGDTNLKNGLFEAHRVFWLFPALPGTWPLTPPASFLITLHHLCFHPVHLSRLSQNGVCVWIGLRVRTGCMFLKSKQRFQCLHGWDLVES